MGLQKCVSVICATGAIMVLGSLSACSGRAVKGRSSASRAPTTLPATPARPVVDVYHGVNVVDPYQWLENSRSLEVESWTKAQAAYTRNYLDHLPGIDQIRAKLQKWNDFKSPKYFEMTYRRGTYFVLKLQPPENQAMLVAFTSPEDPSTQHVVVDPNAIDSSGTTAIDFYQPSLDGKYVAVSLSKGGSEVGTLHLYETATGTELRDRIQHVNNPTAGGSVAWNADGSGFYYTRYPHPGERAPEDLAFYQQIYFHKLGTDTVQDSYSLGKDFPRIAEIHLSTAEDGKHVLATVANGDGGEFAHYVLDTATGAWTQITAFKDKATLGRLGLHDDLYLVSLKGTPRGRILRVSLSNPKLSRAAIFIPQSQGVIQEILPTSTQFYVDYLVGGPSEISVFDSNGSFQNKLKTPPLSDVAGLTRSGPSGPLRNDAILFKSQSYVQPAAWFEARAGKITKTALVTESPVSFADIEVKREFARSKDGTRVPMTILYRKGMRRDGLNPTILYGYGGYGISLTPYFSADRKLWLDQGGIYVVANLRGGGEFGEAWHKAGNLTNKQHVFDDFIACAEYLIHARYTSPEHLAIEGGSNGGLLMGAVLTQRPDLFRVVISHVGIYDMLRAELDPNGAFNVTELGSVKNPAQFKALYAYSPYHHVKKGTRYPAVLLSTGANDGRVNPYHSKKMAARLQAATASGKPVLLRVTFNGGHGVGRSVEQKVSEEADDYAFLFQQLGMTY